jgi:hypothetical protein
MFGMGGKHAKLTLGDVTNARHGGGKILKGRVMIESYLAIVNHPVTWVFIVMVGVVFGVQWITARPAPDKNPDKTHAITRLQSRMGLHEIHRSIFVLAMLLWGAVFGTLFLGLLAVLWELILSALPDPENARDVWSWRFSMVKLTALTATVGAVVALPFTLVRLTLTRRQTETNVEALFNNKIDAAVSDLHAQRQVTRWTRDDASNGWEDDVTRRNGAINRLEGLAGEDPNAAPRIARMLSVYVRELSREFHAEVAPETNDVEAIKEWTKSLEPARSDMQNAAQVLGRLKSVSGLALEDGEIDLRGANLQGCDLSGLNFNKALFGGAKLQGANLSNAELQEANLGNAKLQGAKLFIAKLQGADLSDAKLLGADLRLTKLQSTILEDAEMEGADLRSAQLIGAYLKDTKMYAANLRSAKLHGAYLEGVEFDEATALKTADFLGAQVKGINFTNISISQTQLETMFGDASVILPSGRGPDDESWPEHWSKEELDWNDFHTQWDAHQAKIGYDPDNPQ